LLAKKLTKNTVYLYSILSEQYGSARVVIRSTLRLLENQETKWQSLRQLLVEGEQRGDADYDLEHFIHELDSDNAQ